MVLLILNVVILSAIKLSVILMSVALSTLHMNMMWNGLAYPEKLASLKLKTRLAKLSGYLSIGISQSQKKQREITLKFNEASFQF